MTEREAEDDRGERRMTEREAEDDRGERRMTEREAEEDEESRMKNALTLSIRPRVI